jgi:uncharacterized 2Fe-2S/4Fe-4S cluster protein (DUF4445 family)
MAVRIRVRDAEGRDFELLPDKGLTLAQAVYLSGKFAVRALCSGLSHCGRCRMLFISDAPEPDEAERATLSAAEIDDGWRLGCRRNVREGLHVRLPSGAVASSKESEAKRAQVSSAVMAVDLGTTSIQWSVFDAGREISSGSALNPQLGAGSEVMSRLAFARGPGRAEMLRRLAVSALRDALRELERRPRTMCLAANQAMTCLLLGLPVEGLAAAPYRPCHPGGDWRSVAEGLPEAYVMPGLSAFVGGDALAGVTAVELGESTPEPPYLLIDMGTNGEFVLALPGNRFVAASVPLGPALEGVALSCGSVFQEGAVTGFEIGPQGLKSVGGGERPAGITGAGYVSLLSRLVSVGALDRYGRFASGETHLARIISSGLSEHRSEKRLALPGGLHLTAGDVEEVLKVKAAFNIAVVRLLAEAGLGADDIGSVLLSGALGSHVRPDDLERLGFLPRGAAGRVRAAGNTSLAGAELCARDAEARAFAEALPGVSRVVDLVDEPRFGEKFMRAMQFDYIT